MNHNNFIKLILLAALCHLQALASSGSNIAFEFASIEDKNTLINFAIESNDVYKTRTADRDVATKVFDIETSQIEASLVEKLVDQKSKNTLGFYALKPSTQPDSIELGHLFVRPELIKKGLGSVLFKRAIARAKSLGKQRLHWISDPDAEGFYMKMGARMTGVGENLLNPQVPVPLFEICI